MSFQNKKFTLTRAEKKDTADIEKIMKSGSFSGGIEIQYLRGDDPLASFEKEGTESYIYILREKEHGEAVGMGGCIVRPALVNGKIKRAGYLTGLKVIPEYQRRVMCIPEIYRFLYEETKNCKFEYLKLYKEDRGIPINLNRVAQEKPELIEIRDTQNFMHIGEYIDNDIKIIFNTNTDPSFTKEDLKKIGADYHYYFNKNKQFDETES